MASKPQQGTLFDGFAVSNYDGKFVGGFDLEDEVNYDDVVTFVVTARVDGASFKAMKNGEIKRTNHFSVTSVNALDREMGEKILDSIGAAVDGVNAGQMPLPVTSTVKFGPSTMVSDPDPDPEDDGDDDDADVGRPISDPVLAKFLDS